jgi:phosphoribosylaminoimidazole (AIR) synthetase
MYRVFNMGLGLVLVCAPDEIDTVKSLLAEAMVVGQVVPQAGEQRAIMD